MLQNLKDVERLMLGHNEIEIGEENKVECLTQSNSLWKNRKREASGNRLILTS